MNEWSEPDERGIRTRLLYLNPKRRISGERHRVAADAANSGHVLLDDEHRSLLRDLLRRFRAAWRWERVLAAAGEQRVQTAYSLVSTLLEAGYVEVYDRRDARGWLPKRIVPIAIPELHRLAGIPDREEMQAALEKATSYQTKTITTYELQQRLDQGRLDIRLRRAHLIPHMDRWLADGKTGTRRDFALFATGHTKGIEDADWRWFEESGSLESAGIIEHVPLLHLGGTFVISDATGRMIDIAVAKGPVGLPATTFADGATAIAPTAWIIIENRTVFDKACALPTKAGILWVPGHAPTWWLKSVALLLGRAPAPAVIACDPDPAGIEIASRLVAFWEQHGLRWRLAGMGPSALDHVRKRLPLSQWDQDTLARMKDLPPALDQLRLALMDNKAKGEQEGFFDETQLTALVSSS